MEEATILELLSGRRSGLSASVFRSILWFASLFYWLMMRMRNFAYDIGLLQTYRATIPVVSIGNITAGGTGKTPLAAWLANRLIIKGHKPGYLSRGYRAQVPDMPPSDIDSETDLDLGNDEKRVLDRLSPGVPHFQGKDRVALALRAVHESDCDVLILDDGFQHRRLFRNLDVVLIDAIQPWGYDYVLPRGLLREGVAGLRRADLVVITRVDQCSSEEYLMIRARLLDLRGSDEHIGVALKPIRLVDVNWQPCELEVAVGKRAFAFCGVGNPNSFRRTVVAIGAVNATFEVFPDHHHYSELDLSALARKAHAHSADIVITTQKDLVKISTDAWSGPPLYAIEIGVEFVTGEELFEFQLRKILG